MTVFDWSAAVTSSACPVNRRRATWAVYEADRDDGPAIVAVEVQEGVDTVRCYVQTYGLGYRVGLDTYAAIMKT